MEKLKALGVKAKGYKSNAGDFAQCEAFVNDMLKDLGTVDICVNNAGISKDNLLLRMSPDQWDEVIKVNLNSVFYMTKQVIKPMMKARNGSIINMSSIIGEMGNAGQSSYSASKACITFFKVACHICFYKTWCYGIATNVATSQFFCNAFCKSYDAGFRC